MHYSLSSAVTLPTYPNDNYIISSRAVIIIAHRKPNQNHGNLSNVLVKIKNAKFRCILSICILHILNRFGLIYKDLFGFSRDVALIINRSILPLSTTSVVVFLLASIRNDSNSNNAEIGYKTDKMRITLHNHAVLLSHSRLFVS